MHHNANYWDVTSGIADILAEFFKFIFSVFSLSCICINGPHSRRIENIYMQLLNYQYSEGVNIRI